MYRERDMKNSEKFQFTIKIQKKNSQRSPHSLSLETWINLLALHDFFTHHLISFSLRLSQSVCVAFWEKWMKCRDAVPSRKPFARFFWNMCTFWRWRPWRRFLLFYSIQKPTHKVDDVRSSCCIYTILINGSIWFVCEPELKEKKTL